MNVNNLVQWSQKASSLRRKFEQEKDEIIINLSQEAGVKTSFFSRRKKGQVNVEKVITYIQLLLNTIARKQIPLYNNIINYSQLAQGMLTGNEKSVQNPEYQTILAQIKDQLNIFINYGVKIRKLLVNGQNILRSITPKNYSKDVVVVLYDLWKQEMQLVKKMQGNAQIMHRGIINILKKTEKFYATAVTASFNVSEFLRRNKKTFAYIQIASTVVMAIGMMGGIDTSDIPKYTSKIAGMLTGV